jgi:hypothetical protein
MAKGEWLKVSSKSNVASSSQHTEFFFTTENRRELHREPQSSRITLLHSSTRANAH